MNNSTKTIQLPTIIISSYLLTFLLLIGLIQSMAASQSEPAVGWNSDLILTDAPPSLSPTNSPVTDFGYGFNVAAWDIDRLQTMGFNWMKVFNTPGERLPVNILIRVDANASDFADVNAFGNEIQAMAQASGDYIDAYEIGNEPNLDATYGWGYGSTNVPPNAANYVTLLCEAYGRIKAVDPTAIVVSAGLAPTGRVTGNWNGHSGHNGLFQDEQEFFKEFILADGGDCLDVVGYHPYGYRADFDAVPNDGSPDPDLNCVNGFCFRGVEAIHDLMAADGVLQDKKVWGTEFGWIVEPSAACLADPTWDGRLWQIVSEQAQADNLAGAFEYATDNWPWMGALFVFNLNFNEAALDTCEQMRYYAVKGRPAETSLTNLEKVTGSTTAVISLSPLQITEIITPAQQPITFTTTVQVDNTGTKSLTMTVTAVSPTSLTPTVITPTQTINAGAQSAFQIEFESSGRSVGMYTGTVAISTTTTVEGAPTTIPITLFIFDEIHRTYLPIISKP